MSRTHLFKNSRVRRGRHSKSWCDWPGVSILFTRLCLATGVTLIMGRASAQEALRNSIAGDAAAEAGKIHPETLPYTIKSGDFRLLATPSLEVDWNDNVRLAKENAEQDAIFRPMLGLNASYPLTERNLLQLNANFGYSEYLHYHDLNNWFLQSGSELLFDIFVKDFNINLHDRFSALQDSSTEPAVANTGNYGVFENTSGINITWDLEDVVLSLGYDHQIVTSTTKQFEYTDHSAELVIARAGLHLHPHLTVGIEGTASFTSYSQNQLNNSINYSGGVYADWQPGTYLHVQPKLGYTISVFDQSSSVIPASDQGSWYADVTASHQITDAIRYSISVGHELRTGIQADLIEDTYLRPMVSWAFLKNTSLNSFVNYENGKQSSGGILGKTAEGYDYLWAGFGVTYSPMKRLQVGLNYRLTLRSSNLAFRDYTQNLVGINLSYQLQ